MTTQEKSPIQQNTLEQLCINTIRTLAMDGVQKANSGHPGTPMALAPLTYLLWTRTMRYNPRNPSWINRDRFILSAGHASMLQYSMLHLTGYDLSLEQLKNLRQWGSLTPGHPEHGETPGLEGSTDLAFDEDVGRRFEGYHWHVQHIEDINDLASLEEAILAAKVHSERP